MDEQIEINRKRLLQLLEFYKSDKIQSGLVELAKCIREGHLEGVVQLLKSGIDPDFDVDKEGVTPLIIAIQEDKLDIAKYLLKNEYNCANPNIPDNDWHVPMNHAIRQGNMRAVELLITHDSCENRDYPQIHEACKQETVDLEIVQKLLEERYSPAFKDKDGKTAYDYLRDKNDKEKVLELFKDHGFEEGKKISEEKRIQLLRRVDLIFTGLSKVRLEQDQDEPDENNT